MAPWVVSALRSIAAAEFAAAAAVWASASCDWRLCGAVMVINVIAFLSTAEAP
jgi:hypothetical protein